MDHKHLVETWAFKLSVAMPLFFGGALALAIFYNEAAMSLCFQSECLEVFFRIYRFPLAIAGFSLPLVALVAALQRSKEAAVQIKFASRQLEEAQINNRFGNYLKHREGFSDLINGHCDRVNMTISRTLYCEVATVYNKLFPDSGFNNPSWVGKYEELVMAEIDQRAQQLLHIVERPLERFSIVECVDALRNLMRSLRVSYGKYKVVSFVRSDGSSDFFAVPSCFDERFVLSVCILDVFEVYKLVSIYANNPDRVKIGEGVLTGGDLVRTIRETSSGVAFSMPPSYKNVDERVEDV